MKPVYIIIIVAIVAAVVVGFMIYNKNKKAKATATNQVAIDAAGRRAIENQCETVFNTQAEVDACVAEKLAAA